MYDGSDGTNKHHWYFLKINPNRGKNDDDLNQVNNIGIVEVTD